MSGHKCKNCGSADIEVDNARGDAVCTNCGSVLEDNIIVSEVQFEENSHGTHSAVGQFVSAESKGGGTIYGKFHVGSGRESREVTLKKARDGIALLCQQLSLNNHCIDTACNFFKMALNRHLTRGRRNTHIYAACVYITCRTEGTSHLLIDISDVLRICCYELGRTYLKLTQSLCINIPSVDPCLYIMRFASKLEFGEKTHEVSMTAQRLVQRMKKDSIHSGRRPSGLCGAALLLAARMHDFGRTPVDIIRIVKIHETTLRKRLLEFGDTPSSVLTIEEFMTVDLEAEQDPPAFKAARKKDKEMIQRIAENEQEFSDLQREIEANLDKDLVKGRKRGRVGEGEEGQEANAEDHDQSIFIRDSTLETIKGCLQEEEQDPLAGTSNAMEVETEMMSGIAPDIMAICTNAQSKVGSAVEAVLDADTILDDLEDDEINSYILNEAEARRKNEMWSKLNAEYLEEMRLRQERTDKEREEGKPEKKRKKPTKKKQMEPSSTAGEAIEKILQEKKISSKINYDILKSLTGGADATTELVVAKVEQETVVEVEPVGGHSLMLPRRKVAANLLLPSSSRANRRRAVPEMGLPVVATEADQVPKLEKVVVETAATATTEEHEEEPEVEMETEPAGHSSLATMLNEGADEDYFGYDEDY